MRMKTLRLLVTIHRERTEAGGEMTFGRLASNHSEN